VDLVPLIKSTRDQLQHMIVVEQVNLNEDSDALVWVYEKTGSYSSRSFYVVMSCRGVTPCTSQLYGTLGCHLKFSFFFGCCPIISLPHLII
jgi:hypothetical protein